MYVGGAAHAISPAIAKNNDIGNQIFIPNYSPVFKSVYNIITAQEKKASMPAYDKSYEALAKPLPGCFHERSQNSEVRSQNDIGRCT
jgi:hypothetical protein